MFHFNESSWLIPWLCLKKVITLIFALYNKKCLFFVNWHFFTEAIDFSYRYCVLLVDTKELLRKQKKRQVMCVYVKKDFMDTDAIMVNVPKFYRIIASLFLLLFKK